MKIPEKTIERLSLYYRPLYFLSQQGAAKISSKNLADLAGVKPHQVRKDLSYFGGFGKAGSGYNVSYLKKEIARILGLEQGRKVAIIGVGNLGLALLAYKGFEVLGFHIDFIFDSNTAKIGKKYRGKICQDVKEFCQLAKKEKIEIVILTVPAEAAQEVADMVASCGVKAILNFAPAHLNVPRYVRVSNLDLAVELKSLSFFVSGQATAKERLTGKGTAG